MYCCRVLNMNKLKTMYVLGPALRRGPSLKMQLGCLFVCFSRCRKSAPLGGWLVASRQSWDADWFTRAVFRSRALNSTLFSVRINGEARSYGFGLPGRSVPPHFDSDKLRNELQSQEQVPWKPEARHERQKVAISPRVTKSSNIVCTHYVKVFCILCPCIILFDTSKAQQIWLSFRNSLILSSFWASPKKKKNGRPENFIVVTQNTWE